jgi:hypothetical protein
MSTLNTSRAKEVRVNIFDHDNLPLSFKFTDKTVPLVPVPLDITGYKFEFFLMHLEADVTSYTIDAGQLATTYLNKLQSVALGVYDVLDMQAMFEHIRDEIVSEGTIYKLVMNVIDDLAREYVYVIMNIYAERY